MLIMINIVYIKCNPVNADRITNNVNISVWFVATRYINIRLVSFLLKTTFTTASVYVINRKPSVKEIHMIKLKKYLWFLKPIQFPTHGQWWSILSTQV